MAVGSIHALCICVVESLDSHGKGTFVGITMLNQWISSEQNSWLEVSLIISAYLTLFGNLTIFRRIITKKGTY